jgi:predicted deacylase
VVVDHRGNAKTLRSVASKQEIPAIVFEGGEALKVENSVVELGLRGIDNVLKAMGLVAGEPAKPSYQTATTGSRWLRAKRGGFLRLHVTPGKIVDKGVPVGTIDNLITGESVAMRAPTAGVVIGLRTLPAVKPGDPICHIAEPRRPLSSIRSDIAKSPNSLHRRVEQSQRSDVAAEKP